MNVLFLLICFLIAAVFHQALYIIFPVSGLLYLIIFRNGKMQLNGVIRLFLSLILVIIGFFLLHSILYQSFEFYSLKGIARYISYFAFAVLISHFDKQDIARTFKWLIVYFALTIPLGFYQFIDLGRYQNIFSHANHLAYVLVMCIYFVVFHNPFSKRLKYHFLGLLFVSLLLTKSSGAMLVLLGLWAYSLFKSKRISVANKLLFMLVFAGATAVILTFSEKISEQVSTLEYLDWDFLKERVEAFKPGGYGSFIWRVVYWIQILTAFLAEPLYSIFFGLGIDILTKGNMPYDFMYKDPHNDFLKIFVEYGFIGLLLLIGLIIRVYYLGKRNFNLIILIIVPLLFGNAIVNFPFNMAFLMILIYEIRRNS